MNYMFMNHITERQNECLVELNKCVASGFPTYIYGGGEGARNVKSRFRGVSFAGQVVNRRYFENNKGLLCLEDILNNCKSKINLIVAFKGFRQEDLEPYKDKINKILDYDCWAVNCFVDPELTTYEYIYTHRDELSRIADILEDDYSRDVLAAYINQRISMKWGGLRSIKTSPQYFEESIVDLSVNETFVDCGAFTGDSALSFINALNKRGITSYKKIISFEPDPKNYELMVCRNIDNHICINKGTSDHAGILKFATLGSSSGFNSEGEVTVAVDKLDNMIDEPVSFIKMDIEGAELESLKGAVNLIRTNRPKLAICIYHRKEDLWTILDYINGLKLNYKFYIRAYEDTATELVLYAIPK